MEAQIVEPEPPQNRQQSITLSYNSPQDFIKRTRQLLKEEQQLQIELFNEITQNKTIVQIQASGYGLSNMVVTSTKRGYYGKTIISLTKTYHSEKNPLPLPEQCKIQVGDDVALFKNNTMIADGVVSKRMGPKLQVSTRKELDDDNDLEGINCNVVIKWNEVTFRRYFKALDDMQRSQSRLLPIFFPPSLPKFTQPASFKGQYANPKLNLEQNQAVHRCLKQKAFLLHGPPGTGKTTTVCELIVEAVKRGERVLACGPSNISVDNIVEGLFGRVNVLRIGNPARIIENVLQRCLDYQIAKNSSAWKGEVKKLQSAKKRLGKGGTRDERRAIIGEIKQLRDEIYRLQQQVIQQLLDEAQVICCTNVGADDRVFRRYLPKRVFDLVVIDECGQALEVSCWIPLLKGRRALLAGDHKQLPPTIQGDQSSKLGHTLFTRAMEELQHISTTMLRVQYRMNNAIMGWSNSQFYQGKLQAHTSVETHTLRQLCAGVRPEEDSLLFIDTAGCGMGEEGERNESKMNVGEADLAVAIYRKLTGYGVDSKYIAILTPYSKQVALIKSIIGERGLAAVDVSTVDGIQGREKECIIISMVRSNSKREIGFLRDWRRMNVAVTRARRMLILIGNIECVTVDEHIAALAEWVEKHGNVCSAEQYRGEENVRFGLGASDKIEGCKKEKEEQEKAGNQNKNKKKKKVRKEKGKEQGQLEKKQGKQHSLEEETSVRGHFLKVFQLMGKQLTINNATAFQRKMIHEAAESLGICHETAADKKSIKIWRKMTNDEASQKYAQLQRMKHEEDLAEQQKKMKKKAKMNKNKKKDVKPAGHGNKSLSQQMQMLVGQQSSQQEKQQQKMESKQVQQSIQQKMQSVQETKNKKKKRKNGGKIKQEQTNKQQQDVEQLMRQFNADRPKQDQCFKCKKKITSVTAAECKFCRVNFCRLHLLAEQHGCDAAAIAQAKRYKPSDRHIQQAALKLKQRIKEQQQSRKRKGKDDKK